MLMQANKTSRVRRIFAWDKYPMQKWNEAIRRFIYLTEGSHFKKTSKDCNLSN